MKYYVLKDGPIYYVSESRSTYDITKARKINSIEELITTIPIMKDWNVDYTLYSIENDKETRIEEAMWVEDYRKWKKENPEKYNELYKGTIYDNLVNICEP